MHSTDHPAVRFATAADLTTVARDNYIPVARWQQLIERQQAVVAEQAGQTVGLACFDYLGVVHPYLALIWVAEEHRLHGIGAAMLHVFEDHLRGQGYIVLYNSSTANEPQAQAWHRHMGFEECGFIAGLNEGGVGEVLFRKLL